MGRRLSWGLMLSLVMGSFAYALDSPPEKVETPTIAKPVTLSAKEKIEDKANYRLPRPPGKYIDGTKLALANEEKEAPQGPPMRILGQSSVIQQIPSTNKEDRASRKYYWHPYESWNYCHYREGDRHWYGWRTGETFHWVLWKAGHFWWHDAYAERWLYFDRGYWWWQNPKKVSEFQVYLEDGHFHACDANGVLGDDFLETGTEEIVTEPVEKSSPEKTPGEKGKGRHGGGHHGGSGMGGGGDND